MQTKVREYFYTLFNRGVTDFSQIKDVDMRHLYQLHLANYNFFDKAALLQDVGDDLLIDQIDTAIVGSLKRNNNDSYAYLGESILKAIASVIDFPLESDCIEAFTDWSIMNREDNNRTHMSEDDLNQASYDMERVFGGP